MILEADESHDLQLANWSPGRADGVALAEGRHARHAGRADASV